MISEFPVFDFFHLSILVASQILEHQGNLREQDNCDTLPGVIFLAVRKEKKISMNVALLLAQESKSLYCSWVKNGSKVNFSVFVQLMKWCIKPQRLEVSVLKD